VVAVDAGRITEVDFVLDRHKLTRLSAHNNERAHEPVRAVAGAALRFGPAPVRGYAEGLVTYRSSIRSRS
jgi:hypothetical protein